VVEGDQVGAWARSRAASVGSSPVLPSVEVGALLCEHVVLPRPCRALEVIAAAKVKRLCRVIGLERLGWSFRGGRCG
jgi:hypothetical protein